ncbi:MAG: hypothetical protein SFZ02_11965 [bacterium]|nr:hypothetical protein [bacterium]
MMRRVFVVWVLILVLTMPLLAQDEAPSPFITQTFFADGVEILTIYPIADNENRILHIYDAGEWLHLPYPDDVTGFEGRRIQDNFAPFLVTNEEYGWFVLDDEDRAWYIRRDGSFNKYQFRCYPDWRELYDYMESGGKLAWIYTYLGNTPFLCNMTTYEVSPVIPENLVWGAGDFDTTNPPEPSPDGRYLVLLGYINDINSPHDYRIYSYEIATQTFRLLGDIGGGSEELVNIGMWLSDTSITFSTDGMPEWSVVRYYTADVTQINSLERLSSSLRFGVPYNQESQNFERVPSDFDDGSNIGPCYISIYNETESATYYTGNLCDRGFIIPSDDDERLYRSVTPYASIVRLNLTTGESHNLFIGEVEKILSVSPQGGYALIQLGRNGVVDIGSDPFDSERPYRFVDFSDTLTTYVLRLSDGHLITSVPYDAKWLSDTYLYTQNQLLVLGEGEVEIIDLDGTVIDKLVNGEQLAIHTNQDEFALYTALNGAITPIIPDLKGYTVSLYEREQGILSLSLNHPEESSPNFILNIRLPD